MTFLAKNQLRVALALSLSFGVVALTGCEGGDDGTDDARQTTGWLSTNRVFLIDADGDGMPDAATKALTEVPNGNVRLVRYDDSVTVQADLAPGSWMPGEVLTLWWVFFNNPDACTARSFDGTVRCGIPDLNNSDVQSSLVNAGAGIVADDGSLRIGAGIKEGDMGPAQTGMGLLDAQKADIHIVWRAHGQASTSTAPMMTLLDQLTTFNGGCDGPCKNVMISAHEADDVEELTGEYSKGVMNWWDADKDGTPDFKDEGLMPIPNSYSSLIRDDDGVDSMVVITGAEPGTILTLWLAVFNDPTKCTDMSPVPPNARCGLMDLQNMDVKGSLVNVSGGVVRDDGTIRLGGRNKKGDISAAATGMGLLSPTTADIHLVLRHHGPISDDPAVVAEQMKSFNGGCTTMDGMPGPCPNYTIVPHEHEERAE